jgi:SWIM zinc finger
MSTTFFFGASKVGAVPLGVCFHEHQNELEYENSFRLLKKALGPAGFQGKGHPMSFRIDDSKAEFNALKSTWPQSVILLCIFHLLQSVWRWLWDSSNKILKEDRPNLMSQFRKVVYASNQIDFDELTKNLLESPLTKKYTKFEKYISNLLGRFKLWAMFERHGLLTRGHNTNNICESSIRIFKEVILSRCKSFNIIALIDFVVDILEKYYVARLCRFAHSRDLGKEILFRKFLFAAKDLIVKKHTESQYLVSSSNDEQLFYKVDLVLETCDCPRGLDGRFCKHLIAVGDKYGLSLATSDHISYHDRVSMAKIALGDSNLNLDFFRPMGDDSPTRRPAELENFAPACDLSNSAGYVSPSLLPQSTEKENSSPSVIADESIEKENIFDENLFHIELDKYLEHQIHMIEILKLEPTKHALKKISEANRSLEFISTANGVLDRISLETAKTTRGSKIISVQPTSVARRKSNYKGKKRVQSGGLLMSEPSSKKRKHCLAENVDMNVPNAKIH